MSEVTAEEKVSNWDFQGLHYHILLYCPIKQARCFSIEETLVGYLDKDLPERISGFQYPQPPTIFKINVEALESCSKFFESEGEDANVLHCPSDLGLPNTLLVSTKDGWQIRYDGILIRASRNVLTGPYLKDELSAQVIGLLGEPATFNSFIRFIRESINNELPVDINIGIKYFTITQANYGRLSYIGNKPQAMIMVFQPDNNTDAEGHRFERVYFDKEDLIHQMISHDIFIYSEICKVKSILKKKSRDIIRHTE